MNIEEVDQKFIHKFPVDINKGLTNETASEVAKALGVSSSLQAEAEAVIFSTQFSTHPIH